jgi:hypothetical protein
MSNSPTKPAEFTETGCYLDNHRGHYISRDVIDFACAEGFIIGSFERFVVDLYDSHSYYEDYPQEGLIELCDEAIAWLNSSDVDRISGQNVPPKKPEGTYWSFNDGDFGLYAEDELID